jgi:hypothetical protein
MKYTFSAAGLLLLTVIFWACGKDPVTQPPAAPLYSILADNKFNAVEAQIGLFLSDKEGIVRAFRWLPGQDTAQIQVPGSVTTDLFDCTIVKIVNSEATGTGIRDTSVELTTYTQLAHGESVVLRNLSYQQTIRFKVTFGDVTSVDSIIVPDGLTFARPLPGNQFTGEYLTFHSGQIWIRALLNGESLWRFAYIERAEGPSLTTTLQASLMPPIIAKPAKIKLPFPASWSYKLDGIIDTAARRFVPIGDLLRAPGGFVPTIDRLDVYEPNSGDPQVPTPLPYNKGYRVRLESINGIGSTYKYYLDNFYDKLPAEVPTPTFSTASTVLADARSAGVICTPGFDALSISRSKAGTTHYNWEAFVAPVNGSLVYRLPDVPAELATRYPVLGGYRFDKGVRVRAESYDRFTAFGQVMRARLRNHDLLWQAKAGYLGREEVY